jgi:hypothetical protein
VYSNGDIADRSEQPARRRRRRSRNWVESLKDDPLTALAIAATAGFLVGGGASTHAGRTMLGLLGRIVAPAAALNFVSGILTGNHDSSRSRFPKLRTN